MADCGGAGEKSENWDELSLPPEVKLAATTPPDAGGNLEDQNKTEEEGVANQAAFKTKVEAVADYPQLHSTTFSYLVRNIRVIFVVVKLC